ncbi:pEARLI1-like lipid transfer protein 2 [Zingiber officinale]|uniref:Bifunctional inhibitor/plant lipid transfer protein/seed storage helical domain-containing protein n=1 Tax=Zingiber officinale TaxID=94328 RepID=A0A8J5H4F2_ZINOF|nr:pEARLI1-like lipid transfer protein 2 [Zingiber officinale]KAG6512374.1 hypothetical protein ZIOFF_030485 [Zingiber officinale]
MEASKPSRASSTLFLFLGLLLLGAGLCGAIIAPPSARCPINALGFSVCASLLGGLVNIGPIGNLPRASPSTCCTLLTGLVAFDAETCLCTAFNANVLGLADLNATTGVNLLLNYCGTNATAYRC